METDEETRAYASEGHLVKSPSQTLNPSVRSASRKVTSSRSSVSVQRSSLIPQKEHVHSEGPSNDVAEKTKSDASRGCICGPDLYSRVLGPTADETILTGLQTLIDLCGKLRVCGEKDDSGDEEPEREQDLPEKDTPSKLTASISQTERNLTTSRSQTDSNLKTSKSQTDRSMVSAGFQVNPSMKSFESQTAPYPQMVSEILQTIGLTPEMVSQIIQTSFANLTEPKKTSLASIFMQTSNPSVISNAMQTSILETKSGQIQTSPSLLPTIQEQVEPSPPPSRKDSENQTDSKGDEHKCISTPEPPEAPQHCKCCKCISSKSLRRCSKESKSSSPCVCCSKHNRCKCGPSESRRSTGEHGDQRCPGEVKYAITKISKFKEFTTFEVMRSTKNQPRHMPKGIEGVFVLKRRNGDSQGEVRVKASKRGSNGMKNGGSRTSDGGRHRNSGESTGLKNGDDRSQSRLETN